MGGKNKNPNAVALGRKGGKARAQQLSSEVLSSIGVKGAKARLQSLTSVQRQEIARKAAKIRWTNARKLEAK